jgi:hypothetical protein
MAATSFKTLLQSDVQSARTFLHEAVPVTGTILSGTYGVFPADTNVKNYTHGMFQSLYDYPYLSSSANHILDLTIGMSPQSALSSSVNMVQRNAKNDVYNEMAQILAGYSPTGSINRLDVSGNFAGSTESSKIDDMYLISFARLLTKDEIQKQVNGFQMQVGTGTAYATPYSTTLKIYDKDGTNCKVNSPSGQYNILYASASSISDRPCGLLFYQAGIAAITASVFTSDFLSAGNCVMDSAGLIAPEMFVSGAISGSADALRRRVQNISFNNTTELNSTIYFCRANANEFNYSSNPTYLTGSKIRVTDGLPQNEQISQTVSYVTTVGLYSSANELLAVGKLSEPLKKNPEDEFTLRVRLDY